MTQRTPDAASEPDDPARSMVVERTERADGRYLIYYDWPESPAGDSAEHDDPSQAGADV